jgi:adenylosuccinate lyase
MGKQTAYALVRDCSMEAYEKNKGLLDIVISNDEIRQFVCPFLFL